MASNSMPLSHTLLLLLLLLLLLMAFTTTQEVAVAAPMRPLSTETRLLKSRLIDEGQRRRLGSFQICALCTCCGGPRGICLPSPCCYAINCNIPNRPFGFCSFTPKTCNCFGCHL